MKRLFILELIMFSLACLSGVCYADGYEDMRIKQRAARGYSNQGTVRYEYVGDEDIRRYAPREIGCVNVGSGDGVRDVVVRVNIRKQLQFQGRDGDAAIGRVVSGSDSLRSVDVNVDLASPVHP